MDKVLVGIHVPAIQKVFDAFVPLDISAADAAKLLSESIVDISDGRYGLSHQEMLSLKGPDRLLNPQFSLRDYGIQDGMQLYLI